MGRALLLITLGSFVVLGIIQRAVNNRQITMTEGNIETFMVNQGRNATSSSLDLAINRLMYNYDSDWEASYNSGIPVWTFPIDEMDVDVFVDDDTHPEVNPRFLRVRSELQLEGRIIESIAFLSLSEIGFPELDGALSVYGTRHDRIDFRGRGSELKVNGEDISPVRPAPNDYPPAPDSAQSIPAIAAQVEEDNLVSTRGNVEYDGQPDPYLHDPNLDDTEIMELLETYMEMATLYKEREGTFLGSRDNPVIIKVNAESGRNPSFGGNENEGTGILIVEEDANLTLSGNFDWFGLVIVKGSLTMGGTSSIFGGVIMTAGASVEQDDDETGDTFIGEEEDGFEAWGTPTVQYSSRVLDSIRENLGSNDMSNMQVNRILY